MLDILSQESTAHPIGEAAVLENLIKPINADPLFSGCLCDPAHLGRGFAVWQNKSKNELK
jgi:hypothetical protein